MSDEDAPLRLGYVVQGFARVVPDALVGVGEAPEHGRDDGVKVGVRGSREGDGDRGEADEPAFPVVGRRRRDEIVHEGGDECVEVGAVAVLKYRARHLLHLERGGLALLVQLIGQAAKRSLGRGMGGTGSVYC